MQFDMLKVSGKYILIKLKILHLQQSVLVFSRILNIAQKVTKFEKKNRIRS